MTRMREVSVPYTFLVGTSQGVGLRRRVGGRIILKRVLKELDVRL